MTQIDSTTSDNHVHARLSKASNDSTTTDDENTFAAVLAGFTRSLALSFRQVTALQLSLIKAQLRKVSFQTIRKKSAPNLESHISHVIVEASSHKDSIVKAPSKMLAFARSTILGVAVFGVYELAMDHTKQPEHTKNEELSKINTLQNDRMNTDELNLRDQSPVLLQHSVNQLERHSAKTPLVMHFAAGAVSGLVQSAIMDIWEILNYWFNYRHKISIYDHMRVGINHHLILRRLIHHSVGYALLFGCYEGLRRITLQRMLDYFSSGSASVMQTLNLLESGKLINKTDTSKNEHLGYRNMAVIPMMSAFVAGGISGQINVIANHYTMQWKLKAIATHHRKEPRNTAAMKHHFRAPQFHSVGRAFLPMALSFLAFQYGADLAESMIEDNIDSSRKYLIFVNVPAT